MFSQSVKSVSSRRIPSGFSPVPAVPGPAPASSVSSAPLIITQAPVITREKSTVAPTKFIRDYTFFSLETNRDQNILAFEFTTQPIYLVLEHFIACPKYLDVSYNFKCFESEVRRSPRIMSFINSLWVHILIEI